MRSPLDARRNSSRSRPLTRLNRRSEEIITLGARNDEQRLATSIVTAERLKLAQEARPRVNKRPDLFAKRQAF